MKDKDGGYWCLEKSEGHIHTESHCPNDFKSTSKHKFRSVKNSEDPDVPSGKCVIQSVFDDSYIRTSNEQLEAGIDPSPKWEAYHFEVTDVGHGKVSIYSVKRNKFLRVDGHHAKAKENTDCGDRCHFIIEEINSAGNLD